MYKLLIILLIGFSACVYAEGNAERFFEAGDWAAAADAYARRTATDPEDVAAWFRLAVSAQQAERYDVARNALEQAEERQFSPVRIGLERARFKARAEDREAAVEELRSLAESGFTAVNVITGDPVLATLAGNGRPGSRAFTTENSSTRRV